jgi:pyruvate/2-oxoglutarate dehydrogenase complex dihydrolipoamide acyltransferase (E2) component
VRHTLKLPKLGDTADEVVVLEWLVRVGEHVGANEPLLRVETSKVDAEVPSPVEGTLVEQLVSPGDEVAVGAPLAVVETT